ncbi:hypothetical protein EI94DRAFT_1212925 [Lactarius quietus]|nr:hypothetical protein EI94DRAFT_1212925 [Lactarius quietus]
MDTCSAGSLHKKLRRASTSTPHMVFFSAAFMPMRFWSSTTVFSGVVLRIFLGSIILAWLSNHVVRLANDLSLITSKFDLQIVT